MDGFDLKELEELEKEFLKMAEAYPNKAKSFLRKEGSKLRKVVKANAKGKFKKKTGNYMRGFKRGKPYRDEDGTDTIRVYNNQSHAHLLEFGHVIKGKDGSEHGFKKGAYVLKESQEDFKREFTEDAEEFLSKVVKEGGIY